MPHQPQNKNSCASLRSELQALKDKQQEFNLALDQGRKDGDLKPAQALRAEIEQMTAELKEKLWPFKELPRQELERQYESQKEIFIKTGILERLSNGELGIKGIDDKEYPFPKLPDIIKMMRENKEVLKTKSEQGFKKLLITPFGMKLDDLMEKYKQLLWKHYQEKKLFATMKNTEDQPRFPDNLPFDAEINKIKSGKMRYEDVWQNQDSGFWRWDGYNNADVSGELVYHPILRGDGCGLRSVVRVGVA